MLKRIVVLLLFVQVSFAQNKDGVELCLAAQELSKSFITDEEAENALDKILSVIGASKNFTLQQCDDINNALAVTYKGNRYILYDKNFMKLINDYSDDWSSMFILAHEVGHHINGHTRDAALSKILDETSLEKQRQEELEADKFAGFVLAKLGATLEQTVAAVNLVSTNEDDLYSTHPNKNKRLEAINLGYASSLPKISTNETTVEKSENKKTVTKSLYGWQYLETTTSGKFENDKVEKEIFSYGEKKPTTNSNIDELPKISYSGRYLVLSNLNIKFNKDYKLLSDINKLTFDTKKRALKYMKKYYSNGQFLNFEEPTENEKDWGVETLSLTISFETKDEKMLQYVFEGVTFNVHPSQKDNFLQKYPEARMVEKNQLMYELNGEQFSLEQVTSAAKQSNMTLEAYLEKAGIVVKLNDPVQGTGSVGSTNLKKKLIRNIRISEDFQSAIVNPDEIIDYSPATLAWDDMTNSRYDAFSVMSRDYEPWYTIRPQLNSNFILDKLYLVIGPDKCMKHPIKKYDNYTDFNGEYKGYSYNDHGYDFCWFTNMKSFSIKINSLSYTIGLSTPKFKGTSITRNSRRVKKVDEYNIKNYVTFTREAVDENQYFEFQLENSDSAFKQYFKK